MEKTVLVERLTSTKRRDDSTRKHIVLSFPIDETSEADKELLWLLECNLGNAIQVEITAIARPLPVATPEGPPSMFDHAVDSGGGAISRHDFGPSAEDSLKCDLCGLGETAEVHDAVPAEGEMSDQARDLISSIPPADGDTAVGQEEAKRRLARSSSAR